MKYVSWIFLIFFATLPFQLALNPLPGIDLHSSRVWALALSVMWFVFVLFRREKLFPLHAESMLLFSFFFFSAFSIFFAEHISWGLRKFAFLVSFLPIFLVSFTVLRREIFREKFVKLLVWGSSVSAVVGIVQVGSSFVWGLDAVLRFWERMILPIFAGQTSAETVAHYSSMVVNIGGTNFVRASAFFPDPHIAAFFWGMTLPFAMALAIVSVDSTRWRYVVMAVVIAFADMWTFSRGGLLALCAVGSVFLVQFFPVMMRRYAPVALGIFFLVIVFVMVPNPIFSRLLSSLDTTDGSTSGRLVIWQEAMEIIVEKPFSGVGLGNYSNTVKPSAEYREPRYAHNIFLDIAAETGMVNAGIFCALLIVGIGRGLRRPYAPFAVAGSASLGIFFVHALFETPIYSVHVFPLFLAILGFLV